MRQKVSCQQYYDDLEFYINDQLQDSISGEVDWQQKSYTLSAGIHILKWRYIDGGGDSGDNCGWVDFVQWTGPSPDQDPADWQHITYKHDVNGKRVEKKVDSYSTRYVYDRVQVIAEYDGNNNLLRKYVHGKGGPVCMIEVADSNATYYYHYDAKGSVVALSDSAGDTVQTYEYSVYGEVAVEDHNHTNPYMFAGRRYDIEIGLYYNRARYYNPFMGRFLQTDPIGYGDGMNLYAYCGNNPLIFADPYGLHRSPIGSAQVVTGRYWILPGNVSMSLVLLHEALSEFFALGLVDLGALPVDATEEQRRNLIDDQLAAYEAFLQVSPVLLLAICKRLDIPVIGLTSERWHAYIEVKDWRDTNQNNRVDKDDEFSDPYWIHIEAFGIGLGEDFEQDGWLDTYGRGRYMEVEDAADAAGTAIWAAWDRGIPGVLPGLHQVRGLIAKDYCWDPYNRDGHYHPPGWNGL